MAYYKCKYCGLAMNWKPKYFLIHIEHCQKK